MAYSLGGGGLSDRPLVTIGADGTNISWTARSGDLELRNWPIPKFFV